MTGDIGNNFIKSNTEESVFTKSGPKFGDHAGKIALIIKALYGITTSAEALCKAFDDFLWSMRFRPTRYDGDVWMLECPNRNGYDYIYTHVDDFKVIADDPGVYIDRIASAFFVKEYGPPNYQLGNDYQFHNLHGVWKYYFETHEQEAVRRVEDMFHCLKRVINTLPVSNNFLSWMIICFWN